LLGREWHVEIANAQVVQRIEGGADDCGRRRDRAGFAAALGAQRIVGAGLGFVALGD
jgi:hypothetical protein